MIRIERQDEGIKVFFDEKLLFSHTKKTPLLSCGESKMNYSCENGRFHFSDDTCFNKIDVIKVDDQNAKKQVVFKNDKYEISMFLEEIDKQLVVTFSKVENLAIKLNMSAKKGEHIFGAGEHFRKVDLKGEKVRIFVEEHIAVDAVVKKVLKKAIGIKERPKKFSNYMTYYVHPTFITSDNMSFIAKTDKLSFFDFRKDNLTTLSFYEIPESLTISCHNSVLDATSYMANTLGMMPKLPDFIYDGMILGIQGGTKICDEKVTKMLDMGAKINGIWSQDWCGERITSFGKQVFWDYTIDDKLYSDYKAYIKKWNDEGVKFFGYINPYLCDDGDLFKEAKEKGYLALTKSGEVYLTKSTSFPFGIVDLTNNEAYLWYKENIKKNLIGIGLSGYMADFGEYMPCDCLLKMGSGEQFHNTYATLWSKLNREAVEETNSLGKVVFFTRAGFLNATKYTTMLWNGDQHVDFSSDYGFMSAIKAEINLAYSGAGFSHSDTGGYTTVPLIKRTKELYLRWLETNAFMPFMRSHEGNKPWDNFQFDGDEETMSATVKFTNIYAKLKPYFLAVEDEYHNSGRPMLRSIYMNYQQEKYVNVVDEIMVGEDLLICPATKEKQHKRKVVLPFDAVQVLTNTRYPKGEYVLENEIGTPLVFYKENSAFKEVFNKI